jgi:hypothetical protein
MMSKHGAKARFRSKPTFVSLRWGSWLVATTVVAASLLGPTRDAHADDPFCALFVSDRSVNIDFSQAPAQIRESAMQVAPLVEAIRKALPSDTPSGVRTFYAGLAPLVGQATKIDTAQGARLLASRFVALNGSPAGKTAAAWTAKLCPTALDLPEPTTPGSAHAPRSAVAPSPGAKPGAALDPCSLLTEPEAATALGAAPGPGTSSTGLWAEQCTYDVDAGGVTVTVARGAAGGKVAFQRELANAQQQVAKDTRHRIVYQTLSDLGDGCFLIGGGSMATLVFYRGDTSVMFSLSFITNVPTPVSQIIAVARAVAGRLPR